jgi:hypothetical protein
MGVGQRRGVGVWVPGWHLDDGLGALRTGQWVDLDVTRRFDRTWQYRTWGPDVASRVAYMHAHDHPTSATSYLVGTVTSVEAAWCRLALESTPTWRTGSGRDIHVWSPVARSGLVDPVPDTRMAPCPDAVEAALAVGERVGLDGFLVTVAPGAPPPRLDEHPGGREPSPVDLVSQLRFEEARDIVAGTANPPGSLVGFDGYIDALLGDTERAGRVRARLPASAVTDAIDRVMVRRRQLADVTSLDSSDLRGRVALVYGTVVLVTDPERRAIADPVELSAMILGRANSALGAALGAIRWRPGWGRAARLFTGAAEALAPSDPNGRPVMVLSTLSDRARGRSVLERADGSITLAMSTGSPGLDLFDTSIPMLSGSIGEPLWVYADRDADPGPINAAIASGARRVSADPELIALVRWQLDRHRL